MRVLELFCGTKSISKIWKTYEWEIISVDNEPRFNPSILIDVLQWDYKKLPVGYFDIIWASPPCTCFSALKKTNIGRGKTTRESYQRDLETIGIPLLRKTEEIIQYFQPTFWFMENPQTGDMKKHTIFTKYVDVCYCMYGYGYKKATRIWTNTDYKGSFCNHKGKHITTIGCTDNNSERKWSRTSIDQKYSIPPLLVEEIGTHIKQISSPHPHNKVHT